jgi:DNA-binding MarR family transcriptional regulator
MVAKSPITSDGAAKGRPSDTALETSRMLVEFLHAAYATRHSEADQVGGADARMPGAGMPGRARGTSADVSTHAVRAAIHVYRHGDRTVGQVASGLGISYGWASRVVEELESNGYLIRERDADDRRIVRVRLNPEKLDEVERAYEWRGRAVEEALEPLSEPEREAVRVFLRRVTELLRAGAAEQA